MFINSICLVQCCILGGESESICRETVALFPPPVQTGHPSLHCEACHAPLGFCDICPAGQKYGSRLGNASLQACRPVLPVVSVSPRPPGFSARNMPMQIHLHCSRLLRIFAFGRNTACASAEQIYLFCSRLLCIFAFCFIWGSKVFGYVQCE